MANISTIFKGIHRDTHEGVCPDGECMQLLNVTVEDDGLYAIPNSVNQATLDGLYTHIVKHEHAGRYLAINEDGNLVDLGTLDGSAQTIYYGTITDFQIVGNMVCCFTNEGIYYILYKDSTYNLLGYKPSYPNVIIDDIETKMYYNITKNVEIAHISERTDVGSAARQQANSIAISDVHKALASAYADNAFVDRTFFRAALRLFDGTYISVSPIYCVQANSPVNYKITWSDYSQSREELVNYTDLAILNRDENNYYYGWNNTGTSNNADLIMHYAFIAGFKPTFHLQIPSLSGWKGLVAGIDVFSTGSVPMHDYHSSLNETGEASESWMLLSDKDYKSKVDNNMLFRLYKSFDVDGNEVYSVDGTSMDNFQVQDLLTNVESPSQLIVGENSPTYVYNSRLHISNYAEVLSDGYDPSEYTLCDGMQRHSLYAKVSVGANTYYRCPQLDKIVISRPSSIGESGSRAQGSTSGRGESPSSSTVATTATIWYGWIASIGYGKVGYTKQSDFPADELFKHSIRGDRNTGGRWSTHETTYSDDDKMYESMSTSATYTSIVADSFEAVTILPSPDPKDGLYVGISLYSTYQTSEGTRLAIKNAFMSRLFSSGATFTSPYMVSAPDKRVTQVVFRLNQSTAFLYPLKADAGSNTAYLYAQNIEPATPPIVSENKSLYKNNTLRVSALENPMSFPPDQTYTPDQSAIKGISANTEELGEGQHGENPLYVFTENATYALYVDKTGKTVYPQIDLVSGDVLSGDSISTTDGVLFITKQGVVLLQGKRKTILSKALDGEDSYILPHNTSDGDAMVRKICAASSLSEECERSVQFREYIEDEDCRLGFDYPYSLIYVSNPNYSYTYVYNMRSGEWSKMARSIKAFLRVYPKCWYVDGAAWEEGATHIYDTLNLDISNTDVVVVTRPIKIQRGLKKIKQFLIDGRIRQAQNALTFDDTHGYTSPIYFEGQQLSYSRVMGIYILGSNDGFSYQIASYRETHTPTNCLISHFNRSNAYRYFIICIIGGMRTNTILNGVTFDADAAFSNRLR